MHTPFNPGIESYLWITLTNPYTTKNVRTVTLKLDELIDNFGAVLAAVDV